MEDQINSLTVVIDRLLNNINDDITRTSTYLSSERNNLRTLSAVTNGDALRQKLLASRHSLVHHRTTAEAILHSGCATRNGCTSRSAQQRTATGENTFRPPGRRLRTTRLHGREWGFGPLP
ncbi:MAG: hypothetical protein R3D66_05905 [Alphaproteobacteria bacterium]